MGSGWPHLSAWADAHPTRSSVALTGLRFQRIPALAAIGEGVRLPGGVMLPPSVVHPNVVRDDRTRTGIAFVPPARPRGSRHPNRGSSVLPSGDPRPARVTRFGCATVRIQFVLLMRAQACDAHISRCERSLREVGISLRGARFPKHPSCPRIYLSELRGRVAGPEGIGAVFVCTGLAVEEQHVDGRVQKKSQRACDEGYAKRKGHLTVG